MSKRKIHVIGVGGCGGSTIEDLISLAPTSETLQYFWVKGNSDTPRDMCKVIEATTASDDELNEILDGADLVVLTCGLGMVTGGNYSVTLANMARTRDIPVVVLATMPFVWEGKKRRSFAEASLHSLKELSDNVYTVENSDMSKLPRDTKLREWFAMITNKFHSVVSFLSDAPNLENLESYWKSLKFSKN